MELILTDLILITALIKHRLQNYARAHTYKTDLPRYPHLSIAQPAGRFHQAFTLCQRSLFSLTSGVSLKHLRKNPSHWFRVWSLRLPVFRHNKDSFRSFLVIDSNYSTQQLRTRFCSYWKLKLSPFFMAQGSGPSTKKRGIVFSFLPCLAWEWLKEVRILHALLKQKATVEN